jgi:hypothetical protein
MAAGVILFLDRLELFEVGPLWRLWPSVLVLMGLRHVCAPRRSRSVGWGVTLLLLGTCYLMINYNAMGMTWGNSWPLGIVAVGVGMVLGALLDPGKEVRHE